MRKYSPIRSIKVQNFRNIGEAEFDFSEVPIISLIGENESGKTSVVKAIAVCAMHADPRSQKDYIRDGTNGFGVAIYLQDGTIVTRIKMKSVNRYNVIKADGTEWSADKLESVVPKEVEAVMGMTEEPETKEFLHIRTYEDQLLFVVTPDSTNYKVMYHALKVEQLTKAIKSGSAEVNDLKSSISAADTSINTLNATLSGMKLVDIEPLVNIKNSITDEVGTLSKIESVISMLNRIESDKVKLGAIGLLEKNGVSEINLVEFSLLEQSGRLVKSLEDSNRYCSIYDQLSAAENIETSQISRLKDIIDKCNSLAGMIAEAGAINHIAEVSKVSEMEFNTLDKVMALLADVEAKESQLSIYEDKSLVAIDADDIPKMNKVVALLTQVESDSSQLPAIDKYVDDVISWMKQVGVATTSCPKCGEDIVIDLDLLEGRE